jgi:hypothetical protein
MKLRKTGSETSESISSIAARGLLRPESLTLDEIRMVCASALVQHELPTIPIRRRLKRSLRPSLSSPLTRTLTPNPRWYDHLERSKYLKLKD